MNPNQENKKELIQTIEGLIKEDRLLQSIGYLSVNGNKAQRKEAVVIAGNLTEIDNKKRLGVITDELYILQRNKIRTHLLEIAHSKDVLLSKRTYFWWVIALLITLLAFLFTYHFFFKSEEIAPLEKPRVIGESNHLGGDRGGSHTKFAAYHVKEDGLILDKIVQGKSEDGRSLIFDIVLKNNSNSSISPDNFILNYCYHSGMSYDMGYAGGIIKPIADYIHTIEINPRDFTERNKEDKLAIYPIVNIEPQKTISFRYQIHYVLADNKKHHAHPDWDILFTFNISYNEEEMLRILPVVSWKNIAYSKKNDVRPLDYYGENEINWHKWLIVPSSMLPRKKENYGSCIDSFNADDFYQK